MYVLLYTCSTWHSVRVCTCVCMFVCVVVCMGCMYVDPVLSERMHVCMYVCMYVCTYCIYVQPCTPTGFVCMYV